MRCPDYEQLERLAGGHGDASIALHVDRCAECRDRIVEIKQLHSLAAMVAEAKPEVLEATRTRLGAGSAPDPLLQQGIPGYELLEEISRGGQGVVYQAIQASTRRRVAIKVLHSAHFNGTHDAARFEREVHVLGRLQHPNIVTIHDSGSVGGNRFYVMDFIPGLPLDKFVLANKSGRRTATAARRAHGDTVELFAVICEAVHAAHLRGIIHRDLKPSNIRVDEDGRPHILDFGLAKLADDPAGSVTLSGQFLGSLPWSSPEQAEGGAGLDVRTDVYSLGVILYGLLTDEFPYDVTGGLREVLDRIVREDPRPPSAVRRGINAELETIILKCLSKAPDRRYQSAGELARDLRLYLAGDPIEAKRDSGMYIVRKMLRRHRVAAAFSAAIVLVLCAATGVSAWFAVSEKRQRDLAELRTQEFKYSLQGMNALLRSRGDFGSAIGAFRDIHDRALQEYGDPHPFVATSAYNLAEVLRAEGRYADARRYYREAIEMREQLTPEGHPGIAQALGGLAAIAAATDDHEHAVRLYRRALASPGGAEPTVPGHRQLLQLECAKSLVELDQFPSAEQLLIDAESAQLPEGAQAGRMAEVLRAEIDLYTRWDRFETSDRYAAAIKVLQERLEAVPARPGRGGDRPPTTGSARTRS